MMVFNFLTSHIQPKDMKELIISPNSSFEWLIKKIENEIDFAKKNLPSGIWIKCNAIVDSKLIEKLYEASNAGVKINLFVRGICCLKPNVKGLSENIIVKSIIGRFLTAAVATGTICFTSIFFMIIENRCKAFNALEIDLVDNFPVSNNFSPNLQLILSLKRG